MRWRDVLKHNVTTPLTIKNLTVVNSRGQALLSDISVSLNRVNTGGDGAHRFRQILTGIGCLGADTRHIENDRRRGAGASILALRRCRSGKRQTGWAHHPVAQTSLPSDDADWQTDHAVPPTSYRRVVSRCRERTLALMDLVGLRDPFRFIAHLFMSFLVVWLSDVSSRSRSLQNRNC